MYTKDGTAAMMTVIGRGPTHLNYESGSTKTLAAMVVGPRCCAASAVQQHRPTNCVNTATTKLETLQETREHRDHCSRSA